MTEGGLIAGKYQLLRRIAQGGMAEVYLARQTGLEGFEKLVVIKRILPHLVESQDFVRMFLDEARTAADLRHPNVVQIFEIGEDAGTYYIAMEFLHGQDIRRVMRRQAEQGGRVPLQHALQMIIDAANGLDHAHKKKDLQGRALNIIHRDISPQNIIVTYDGTTKIVDFGIAKAASQSTQTASGVLKGKYSYMSPEQASGRNLDQRTDQFALGIVLWELVTMRRLFKQQSEILTLHAIIEGDIAPPRQVLASVPPALNDIVMKTLSVDRNDRYADCRAMAEALEEFMAEQRLLHSPTRVGAYMQEIFRETLEAERSLGTPLIEETSPSSAGPQSTSLARRGTGNRGNEPTPNPAQPPQSSTQVEQLQQAGTQVTQAPVPEASAPLDAVVDATRTAGPQRIATRGTAPHRLQTAVAMAAPGGSRRLMAAGAAVALALMAAVGVGLWLLRGPGTVPVVVRTSPPGAALSVDGTALKQRSPTVVPELDVGRTYAFRAELPGYAPSVRNVRVLGEGLEVELRLDKDVPRTVLLLKTTPAGARAYLDGKTMEGLTPLELPGVPLDADQHVLTFSLGGHADDTQGFTLKVGRTEVTATLVALKDDLAQGYLNITSSPPGAAITVGGKPLGPAPISHVPVGGGQPHTVGATLPGYDPVERLVDVDSNATVDVALELEKERHETGWLTLDTVPEATVYLDRGRALGTTPLKRVKVPAGLLSLRLVNKKKGLDYTEKLRVAQDQDLKKTVRVPKGRLKVVVTPWANVYVDGLKVGQTPMAPRRLFAGRHEVRLINDKLGKDEKQVIVIRPGEDTRIRRSW